MYHVSCSQQYEGKGVWKCVYVMRVLNNNWRKLGPTSGKGAEPAA